MKNLIFTITSICFLLISGSAISAASGISPYIIIPSMAALSYVVQPHPGVFNFAYALANLPKPSDIHNNGGTKKFFYLSNVVDITTLQPIDTYAAAGDEAIISANHVWATGKAAAKVYLTEDTGEVMYETIGSRDGRSFKATLKGFHPGAYPVFAEAAHNAKAIDAIVHVPLANGKVLQLGQAGEECEVLVSWKSNKRSGDGAGFDIEVTCFTNIIIFYEGTIDNTF